jgi:DNA-nicking Smr family endonuclease
LTKKISKKDKEDWDSFITNSEKLLNKDDKFQKRVSKKIKSIDLHGYNLDEANRYVEDFIIKSYDENIYKIIVVTGKGLHSQNEKDPYVSKDLSILKYSIPEFIENNFDLMKKIIEIKDAKIEDGGSGAFYIYLKNKK